MPRIQYTQREYANMHSIYGECRGNASASAVRYRERYPNARHPDYRVFIRVHNAYCEGRISSLRGIGGASEGRPRQDFDDEVLDEINDDPSTSVRTISRRTGVSKTTVHRILKRYQLHPFHVQRVQTLLPRDYPLRVEFCRRMLRMIRVDPDFFNKILWSDESSYRRDGFVNLHNLHSWQLENPHLMREDRSQYQFKVNLWSGILNGQVVGPFELPPTLTSDNYLEFLQNDLPVLLEDFPLSLRLTMWLQNDGCPAHYGREVRAYQNLKYPGRWIGRLAPILWPPRSPDLNPLDFFYWGCIKEKVYFRPVQSLNELHERIGVAAEEISRSGYSRNLKRSFIKRCRACIRAGGEQFENLL